ncbi:MAG TPA: GntR family transcriptional regulator [Planctomycetota bacterium]|nr:GntR family transcriptional regulator [Planctomycetota bacterium]
MPRPDHVRLNLLAQLRRHIENCHAPGDKLPSQRELAVSYGGTASTIRRALGVLQKEGIVAAVPRVGWVRAPLAEKISENVVRAERKTLRVGLISRRRRLDWDNHDILRELMNEARRRGVEVVEVPNPRQSYPTRARARVELIQVPWNAFDVGMLVEIEDPITLGSPLLTGKRVLSVDQDSTMFGLNSIHFANWEAGVIAARYLYDMGHRRFSVTDEVNSEGRVCDPSWTARRLGFESTLSMLGGIIRPEWRIAVQRGGRPKPGYTFKRAIGAWAHLPADERPTALFAMSGFQMPSIIQAMRDHDLSTPEDMSIISVGWKMEERLMMGLELTMIYLSFEQLIRRTYEAAAEVARRPVLAPGSPPLNVVLPVTLVEGNSTRAQAVKPNEYA